MKVLIVDDDAINVAILAKFFTSQGMQVSTAYDGAEALRLLEETQFDLVVTDILMPKVEGIEIIGEIRNQNADIPIIAMSSDGDAGYTSLLTIAKTMGANLTIKKPVTTRKLSVGLKTLGISISE